MAGNEQIVRQFIALLNAGDVEGALTYVAADGVLDWSRSEAPDSGVHRGREAWSQWMASRLEGLPDTQYELTELIDAPPDRVVLVSHVRSTGRVSGAETQSLGAAVLTLAGGLITALTMYQTSEEARRAAGLQPG